MLDALVHLSVTSRVIASPPSTPAVSEAFLVGENAMNAWAGHEGDIAVFVDGFWMYHTPKEGWLIWISDESVFVIYNGAQWLAPPVPTELSNLQSVGIGLNSDATNKLAVAADSVLLTHDGTDHRLKINKNSASDTASVLFQANYAGHAEFGITGDNDWHVKTSVDSSVWNEAIVARADTGAVSFPNGTHPDLLVPAVDGAGGTAFVLGPPSLHTVAYGRANFSLAKNRAMFSAFHVDRPTELLGGAVAQFSASTDVGSVMRTGVYELGEPNGDSWDIGSLVADFGTLPADTTGHKNFDLTTPIVLEPGWYLNMIGTNGSAVQVRFQRWMTPGLLQYAPFSSGGGTDFRTTGPSSYLYENSMASVIENGLPSTWITNPAIDALTSNGYIHQLVLPKWTRW